MKSPYKALKAKLKSDDENKKAQGEAENPGLSPAQSEAQYRQIKSYISAGRYNEAQTLLSAVRQRDAEWYFLKGEIELGTGSSARAVQYMDKAVSMEPENEEYRKRKEQIKK